MIEPLTAPEGPFGLARVIDVDREDGCETMVPRFTIATLVTNAAQYQAMQASFIAGGFTADVAEYLSIDNRGPRQTSAARGLNAALVRARGRYVILCHQDVRLFDDGLFNEGVVANGLDALEQRLAELDRLDPAWALAGNAGGVAPGRLAIRITDPHGANVRKGTLPARVSSLDENFIIVRRAANIGFSADLEGFHFYGADLCLHASLAGRSAFVIDFHLRHLSAGRKDANFYSAERVFRRRWSRALRPRLVQTTCALVWLSGGALSAAIAPLFERPLVGLLRRLLRSTAAASRRDEAAEALVDGQ